MEHALLQLVESTTVLSRVMMITLPLAVIEILLTFVVIYLVWPIRRS